MTCPRCGEDRLIEWDAARGCWDCAVCACSWREAPRGRPRDETRLASVITLIRVMTCTQCGTEFTPRRRRRDARFCSGKCRAGWHARRKAAVLDELTDLLGRIGEILRELRNVSEPDSR